MGLQPTPVATAGIALMRCWCVRSGPLPEGAARRGTDSRDDAQVQGVWWTGYRRKGPLGQRPRAVPRPPPDAETAVRTTGLLTAGRNPGRQNGPRLPHRGDPSSPPHQGREVFGDVYRCSRQPGDADFAGPGHEPTLLPRVGLSGRIRPAGRDGTGDSLGEASGPGCGLRGPRWDRESCPGETGCTKVGSGRMLSNRLQFIVRGPGQ